MDTATIGNRLREVRVAAGFTQDQVSRFLEVKREAISYIENGRRPVSTVMLRKLADLYGYRMSYFLDEAVRDTGPQMAIAFRVSDLEPDDLPVIAETRRIASNLDSLYRLLEE